MTSLDSYSERSNIPHCDLSPKYNICSKDYDELLMNIDQDNVSKKFIILLARQKTPHHL